MKNTFFTVTVVSCLGAFGALAQVAQDYYVLPEGAGPYLRAEAGPSFFQDGHVRTFGGPASGRVEYQVGGFAGAAFGYAFNNYIATDFELGFNAAKIDNVQGYISDNSRIYNMPFMGNLILTCPIPHSNVTPYIGAGAGGANVVFDTDRFSDGVTSVFGSEDDVVFAWQAFAGLRFQLTPRIALDVGYKYFNTGDPNFSYPPSPNFDVGFKGVQTHSILASLHVSF
jgi:opacity protein-like surface antigen